MLELRLILFVDYPTDKAAPRLEYKKSVPPLINILDDIVSGLK